MLLEPRIDCSQYGQPTFIRRFIPPRAPRWVVDVGAHDGIDCSNSRGFVLEGWTALLIEPLPAVFEALKANSEGLSNARLERCACGESEGVASIHIGLDGPNGQTSSLCPDEIWKRSRSGQEIEVQVRTLTSLLSDHKCPRDFAMLLVDAEGMDLEVLSGLDFSRFRPSVVCTEIYRSNQAKDHRKAELLEKNGYRLKGIIGSDMIWTCTDFEREPSNPLFSGTALPNDIADLKVTETDEGYFDQADYTNGVLTLSGWAMAPDHTVPGVVLLGVKTSDGFHWRQSARHPRTDVALYHKNPALQFSGFVARFPLKLIESQILVTIIQIRNGIRWDKSAAVPVVCGDLALSCCGLR